MSEHGVLFVAALDTVSSNANTEDQMIKVCMIGATGHVGYVTDGLEKAGDVRIVGVAPGSRGEDISPLVNRLRELRPGDPPAVYDDYKVMLDELTPGIAVVACWFGDHARVAGEVLKRDISAFVEKPIATSPADLKELRDTFAASSGDLSAMFGLRYAPWMYTAWHSVRSGQIGRVRLIDTRKSYKLGKRGRPYLERETYGGTIPWVGSHAIDWIHWFSRKRFLEVGAAHSKRENRGHGDLETTAVCRFTLEDEVFATASIDYLRPAAASTHGDDRIRIVGTDGIVEVMNAEPRIINQDGERALEMKKPGQIFLDFVTDVCVRAVARADAGGHALTDPAGAAAPGAGAPTRLVSADDAFTVTEACLLARQSADTGRPVRFPGA